MGRMMSEDELVARDQATVAKCARWVKENITKADEDSGFEWADALWKAMGYEGALNDFELEE